MLQCLALCNKTFQNSLHFVSTLRYFHFDIMYLPYNTVWLWAILPSFFEEHGISFFRVEVRRLVGWVHILFLQEMWEEGQNEDWCLQMSGDNGLCKLCRWLFEGPEMHQNPVCATFLLQTAAILTRHCSKENPIDTEQLTYTLWGPIFKIHTRHEGKNTVVDPNGARNQEWLCWRRPAANSCSALCTLEL
jgi:hypothetical protein